MVAIVGHRSTSSDECCADRHTGSQTYGVKTYGVKTYGVRLYIN